MKTFDRINALRYRYDLPPIPSGAFLGKAHDCIDLLDRLGGIDTSGGIKRGVLGGIVPVNPVGARVALHELHWTRRPARSSDCERQNEWDAMWDAMDAEPEKYFHWLGHDACCRCGCAEHRRT